MTEQKSAYEKMTKAEKEVADYLRELNIWWRFEHPVFAFDERERPRVWTPDFYLPELGIYIEVCGSEDFDYKYRVEIYKKNRIPVIFLHQYKQDFNWKSYLRKRLIDIFNYRSKIFKGLSK
jgi:hypothetical protein